MCSLIEETCTSIDSDLGVGDSKLGDISGERKLSDQKKIFQYTFLILHITLDSILDNSFENWIITLVQCIRKYDFMCILVH